MNIEKIKNFSQDEQKILKFFELLRNEIIARDNELNEGIDFIFGRKFATKIDLLLNLVITLEEDKEELQKENEKLEKDNKCYINSIQSIVPVISQDYIEKQKIKDKIEELQKEYKYLGEENQRINKFEIELLQKILEGDN